MRFSPRSGMAPPASDKTVLNNAETEAYVTTGHNSLCSELIGCSPIRTEPLKLRKLADALHSIRRLFVCREPVQARPL